MNGGVPQGTLSGPELFIHMLSDFNTVARCVKYVDDSTVVEVSKKKLKSDKSRKPPTKLFPGQRIITWGSMRQRLRTC